MPKPRKSTRSTSRRQQSPCPTEDSPEDINNAFDVTATMEDKSKTTSSRMFASPSKYYGDLTTDVESWLKEFNRIAAANKWDTQRKTEVLPAFLRDRAADFFEDLEQDEQKDYDVLCEKLKERFRPKELQRAYYSDLFQRKQFPNETAEDYGHEILKLARKAHSGLDREVTDKLTMEHFINGLQLNLKRLVMLADPTSFEQAVRYAKREECHNKLTSSAESAKMVCSTSTTSSNAALEAAVMSLTEQVEGLSKKVDVQNQTRQNRRGGFQGRSTGRGRGRNLRTTDGQPICNYCNRVGHIEPKCYQKHGYPSDSNSGN